MLSSRLSVCTSLSPSISIPRPAAQLSFALYDGEWSTDVTATTTRRFLVSHIEFGEAIIRRNKRKVVAVFRASISFLLLSLVVASLMTTFDDLISTLLLNLPPVNCQML